MKSSVIVFPGSNCDRDLMVAIEKNLGIKPKLIWHQTGNIKKTDLIFLPGGFSYGDYLRSGAIARFSPIMKEVVKFANNGGFVLGICNGFQILCEANLLPGTLIRNQNHSFICKNVFIKPQHNLTIFTENTGDKSIFKIPIAHAEGCYFADENTLQEIIDNKQIIFKYCDAFGEINKRANPNGSLKNIAGICNLKRNIFGMMPHPERACDSKLNNIDGKLILQGAINIFKNMGK